MNNNKPYQTKLKGFNWKCEECGEDFTSAIEVTEIRMNTNVPLDLDDLDGEKGTCLVIEASCTECSYRNIFDYTI